MEQNDAIKLLAGELAKRNLIYLITDEKLREQKTEKNAVALASSTLNLIGSANLWYEQHERINCESCGKRSTEYYVNHWYLAVSPTIDENQKDKQESFVRYDLGELPAVSNSIVRNRSKENVLEQIIREAKKRGANYLFGALKTEIIKSEKNTAAVTEIKATPYAIIGDEEEKALREIFYKNVPKDIKRAMSSLEIQDFEELYDLYCKNSEGLLSRIKELEAGDKIFVGIEGASQPFRTIERINGKAVYCANNSGWFNDIDDYIRDIKIIEKNPLTEQFLNFVFKLPEEEQNEQSNQVIINAELFDATQDFLYLYKNNPEKFMRYFPISKEENRQSIASRIKMLEKEEQNKELNSFIFSRGYDVYVEFLDLYKNDAGAFSRYFTNLSETERREIVNSIFGLTKEEINPDISKWLSNNYHDLVEDVGMNRVKSE